MYNHVQVTITLHCISQNCPPPLCFASYLKARKCSNTVEPPLMTTSKEQPHTIKQPRAHAGPD